MRSMMLPTLRTVTACRYVTPFRQGGSVPALIEADDESLYVTKLHGAAQGPKALIAELLGGEIARTLGLNVPELVFVTIPADLAEAEPHAEIRDSLRASVGLNLGLRFLPYALDYNPRLRPAPSPAEASAIVWFDALITNVDRTLRNINILWQGRKLWLIDHGAAFYFHHGWRDYEARSQAPFALIRDHALLPFAAEISAAGAALQSRLSAERLAAIAGLIPDAWLQGDHPFAAPAAARRAYAEWLAARLAAASLFTAQAESAYHAQSV